ncbi:hypothetical protein AJ80_03493 [Polytolypa hystricis UAMH7299]|uniref:mannan endo-1,4-beta-mannosidase n=1 Tax=Polytolypa hystricis (strain UAMH7299) TaxID=1447883 RepID=A0A2B7YI87_POLH7|nr:hypothetical protein AJ80_03493 [Polytolypa hystricis UAMH7299]
MKFSATLVATLAGLAAASPTSSHLENKAKRATISNFVGTNAYWLPGLSDADMDTAFRAMANAGMKVVRTWAFNDQTSCSGFHLQCWSGGSPTINTGTNGLGRLDAVVSKAETYGIQLILPFVNYWDDYGGMNVYVSQMGGGSTSAFYTNSNIITAYKNYIQAVVNRYKNSNAIYAWELANEPRCPGCATSVITQWATSISQYIKQLDPSHRVVLGDEGWFNRGSGGYPYQGGEGVDFEANLRIATLDLGTFHMYPSHWGESYEWGNQWIADHQAACKAAGKDCILEEYGVGEDGATRTTHMTNWHNTLKGDGGVPGDMFWQFGLQLSNGPTHDDTFTIYNTESNFQSLVSEWARSRNGGSNPDPQPPTSTTTTTTPSNPGPTNPPGGVAGEWQQCGGLDYSGPTVCASPFTCHVINDWYHQCY